MFDTLKEIEDQIYQDLPLPNGTTYTYAEWGNMLINIIIALSFSFSILGLAFAMVMYVTSGGNPDKTRTAWSAFIYSVIAAIISLCIITLRAAIYRLIGFDPGDIN